jgi:hypothetical protein
MSGCFFALSTTRVDATAAHAVAAVGVTIREETVERVFMGS